MADNSILDYGPASPRRRVTRAALGIVLLVIPAVIFGLYELQRMPYRPPQDMSTFLGGEQIMVVRSLMLILGVVWLIFAAAFALTVRRRSPGGGSS